MLLGKAVLAEFGEIAVEIDGFEGEKAVDLERSFALEICWFKYALDCLYNGSHSPKTL